MPPKNPIIFIDDMLNSFTMYRLVLVLLTILSIGALIFSLLGILPFSAGELIVAFVVVNIACFVSNFTLAKLFKAPANFESALITAIILFLIVTPGTGWLTIRNLILISTVAMASKYLLAYRHKHLFNPAAIAVLLFGVANILGASWWVGIWPLVPINILLGLLIVRKVRRFQLLISFLVTSLTVTVVISNLPLDTIVNNVLTSWPLIFFATVMLTEPQTMPPTSRQQIFYGALVGLVYSTPFNIGPLYPTPELALVIGNLYTFFVSPKGKLKLILKAKNQLSPQILDLVFIPNRELFFNPGQYLEWTLATGFPDVRGNRRIFTIASSPTEKNIHLGLRISQPSSTFKRELLRLKIGESVTVGQLAGEFNLPQNRGIKLAFIAGGIGITPYRSMVKYLLDTGQKRDIVLFFANRESSDFVYGDIFDEANEKLGLKQVKIITDKENVPTNWLGKVGFIDEKMLIEEIPDYQDRRFYLSGPPAMVRNYKALLLKIGVSRQQIVTDFFAGY